MSISNTVTGISGHVVWKTFTRELAVSFQSPNKEWDRSSSETPVLIH